MCKTFFVVEYTWVINIFSKCQLLGSLSLNNLVNKRKIGFLEKIIHLNNILLIVSVLLCNGNGELVKFMTFNHTFIVSNLTY